MDWRHGGVRTRRTTLPNRIALGSEIVTCVDGEVTYGPTGARERMRV